MRILIAVQENLNGLAAIIIAHRPRFGWHGTGCKGYGTHGSRDSEKSSDFPSGFSDCTCQIHILEI